MPFLTALTALAGVVLLTLVAVSFSPRFRAARAHRMSASVGLALDESVAPRVERALAIRLRATAIGPRIARSREVTLRDYVMPLELAGARVLIGIAAVAAVTVVVLLRGNPRETTIVASVVTVTLLAIAALVVFEVAGPAIIARPSPALDPTSLAWEDALRAETLRTLVTAPLTFGGVSLMLAVVGAFGVVPPGPVSIVAGAVVPFLVLVTGIVIAVAAAAQLPQRHFLRVLWPETAAAASRPAPTATPESAR